MVYLLIFLFLTSLPTIAQKDKFAFIFEAGHDNRSLSIVTFEKNIYSARLLKYSLYYSSLEASWQPIEFFKPEVKVQSWFRPEKINSFNPFFVRYDVNFNFLIKNIEFGYQHYCFHSIDRIWLNDATDNFFVRIKIK